MRVTLNFSQLIDLSITNGAKLINLLPEIPLFKRSDKLVSDLFELHFLPLFYDDPSHFVVFGTKCYIQIYKYICICTCIYIHV